MKDIFELIRQLQAEVSHFESLGRRLTELETLDYCQAKAHLQTLYKVLLSSKEDLSFEEMIEEADIKNKIRPRRK